MKKSTLMVAQSGSFEEKLDLTSRSDLPLDSWRSLIQSDDPQIWTAIATSFYVPAEILLELTVAHPDIISVACVNPRAPLSLKLRAKIGDLTSIEVEVFLDQIGATPKQALFFQEIYKSSPHPGGEVLEKVWIASLEH